MMKSLNKSYRKQTYRPIFALLFLLWLIICLPLIMNNTGNYIFNRDSYATSHKIFTLSSSISWYEKYIPLTNKANSSHKEKKYDRANEEYGKALESAEGDYKCIIRYNWAVNYFELASSSESSDTNKATRHYLDSLRTISSDECISKNEFKSNYEAIIKLINERLEKLKSQKKSQQNNQEQQEQDDNSNVEKELEDNEQEIDQQNDYKRDKQYEEDQERRDQGEDMTDFVY